MIDSPVAIACGVQKVSQKAFVISPAFEMEDSICLRADPRSHFQSFSMTRLNSGVVVTLSKNASKPVSCLVIMRSVRKLVHVRFELLFLFFEELFSSLERVFIFSVLVRANFSKYFSFVRSNPVEKICIKTFYQTYKKHLFMLEYIFLSLRV